MKNLTSYQRRLLSEQNPSQQSQNLPQQNKESQTTMKAEKPPIDRAMPAEKQKAPSEPLSDAGGVSAATNEAERAERAMKALEKLQDAAVGLEAGRFVMQHEYSDFSLAKKLESLKHELVDVIGKIRDHILHSSASSPEAKQVVSKWLDI